MNWKALGVVLFVASALISAMLTTEVQGFAISPAARYWLTIAQAGIAAGLLFVPGLTAASRRPDPQNEHAP